MTKSITRLLPCLFCIVILFVGGISCQDSRQQAASGKYTHLDVWAHAGREAERQVLQKQIERFEANHPDIRIHLTFLPEGSYNSQVQAAALADELPDVLEFDGPFVYNYAWQGKLLAIGDLLSAELEQQLLPSIITQGTYNEKLFSVGMYDSGLALFARKSMLEKVQARIPKTPEEAWTVEEFNRILAKLAENDPDQAVLDLKLNYGGEWFTYAFSPILQSAGADLIDRSDYSSASGVLNNSEAVAAMTHLQNWIEGGYVDPNVDDAAFVMGRVALSWVGHWEYQRYSQAFADDLVLVPLPDFGQGTRTGQGSWNWGVTQNCSQPEQAMKFLEFLLAKRQILEMTQANSAIPATYSAVSHSPLHQEGDPLDLYVTQLTKGYAVARPRTPAYPIITYVFQQAFSDIRNGLDVKEVLDRAAAEIDQDIQDNQGYPEIEHTR